MRRVGERVLDGGRTTWEWLADETELRKRRRREPDLVTDEVEGRGAECGGQLGPDGDQRPAHDGEGRRIREATARNESRSEPDRLQLGRDLRAGAVDDDDLVARRMPFERDPDRVASDATAQLQNDRRIRSCTPRSDVRSRT